MQQGWKQYVSGGKKAHWCVVDGGHYRMVCSGMGYDRRLLFDGDANKCAVCLRAVLALTPEPQ